MADISPQMGHRWEREMSALRAVNFETAPHLMTRLELPVSDPQTQPTVFTEEENAALSTFSAVYSAGLNGSGPVNRFHHAKGRDLVWTETGLRHFFSYADPGIERRRAIASTSTRSAPTRRLNRAPAGIATNSASM
jgi:hypothetical protein